MNYLPLVAILLGVIGLGLAIFNLYRTSQLNRLRKTFFVGNSAASLEDFIINQNKKLNELAAQADRTEEVLGALKETHKYAIQKIGVVRYNPFVDDGGNLSFSIAILDALDNGVVITSLHGREQNRVYAKPIQKGKSDFSLTEEEKNAISSSKILKD